MSMLDNFKVIEITKTTEPACVIIEDNKLRFTKPVAIELGYPAYVRILMDDAGQRIAIQVAKGNESNVVKFSAEKESQKTSIVYQNSVMVDLIRGVMPSWEKGIKYRAKGILSKEDKAIVFDLKAAEIYQRFHKKDKE